MKITYKKYYGMGTLISPTYRRNEIAQEITCSRAVDCGGYLQLYNHGGFTICAIDKRAIIRIA